jgi:general secretion pathway protein A
MYESFYGFLEWPFDLTPNPRYMVMTSVHREALSTLQYGISANKGIALLVGEAGTGKTSVIRTALSQQPARVHCVHLHNPALTRAEFVEMLAARFGLSERAHQSKTVLLLELEQLLRDRYAAGETTVLVVDEAQSLPLDLLEEVRLLANIESDAHKLLAVIIAGQPELAQRLNEASLRQLKQRVALRCELRPLTLAETAAYLAGRIRAAGGVGAQVFTREAVGLIHEHARGIPRTISVIAYNALLSGFATGERPVSSATVREVCRDFDLQAPTRDAAPVAAPPAESGGSLLALQPAPPVPATIAAEPAPGATAAEPAGPGTVSDASGRWLGGRRLFSLFQS